MHLRDRLLALAAVVALAGCAGGDDPLAPDVSLSGQPASLTICVRGAGAVKNDGSFNDGVVPPEVYVLRDGKCVHINQAGQH